MKIKIFEYSLDANKFEKRVNEFIFQDGIKVLELQYSSSINGSSVMIVYEEHAKSI